MAKPIQSVALLALIALMTSSCAWWTRANVSTAGEIMPEPEEFFADLSDDGTFVAFHTLGALRPDDGPATDIYRRNIRTGEIELVSRGDDGAATVGDRASYDPSISADGRIVAFESYSDNLVPGDTNDAVDVFVRDVESGLTTRVSVGADGTEVSADSNGADVSADGRYVVFTSWAADVVANDTNDDTDVFRHDRVTGETIQVSVPAAGHPGGGYQPIVNADGSLVAYEAPSTAVAGAQFASNIIVITDLSTGITVPAIVDEGGNPVSGGTLHDLSGDGRFVVFGALFVFDTELSVLEQIHVTPEGQSASGWVDSAGISDDGRFVVFHSVSNDLVEDDDNSAPDTFVRDRLAGTTTRQVPSEGWVSGGNEGTFPAISADGRTVAFEGLADVAQSQWGPYDLFIMANPTPRIGHIEPSVVGPGLTEIRVFGTGFLDDTALISSAPGVTVAVIGIEGGTEIVATITVGPEAPSGPITIATWNASTGSGSGAGDLCAACIDVTG